MARGKGVNAMYKKSDQKKSGEELQQYLMFRRRGHKVRDKTKYTRKVKHKKNND